MEFRPCIDIHNGQVKQIVGSSLQDEQDQAKENFVAQKNADHYARLYRENGIKGGHIIMLNPATSEYFEATKQQALLALSAYPQGLQIGGGMNADNAGEYLEAGASHVIVTSYAFRDGEIQYENLQKLRKAVGKDKIVLDLSCRFREGAYYIVTDRWQKYTKEIVSYDTLDRLMEYCDEFLIHAVDVEGKAQGIETALAELLGGWGKLPITYAGGVHSYEDIDLLRRLGHDKVHVTIGSALDLFGGNLSFTEVMNRVNHK